MAEGAVAIIGAGGHAKVVLSTLLAAGFPVAAAFDDDPEKWGTRLLDVLVAGDIRRFLDSGLRRAVLAIGSNPKRRDLAARLPAEWVSVAHPSAWVDETVCLGPGTVIFAGAVIQPCATLGAHVIVNSGATIDHDCAVGDFAHVGPGVSLAGGVEVGEGALLGIGSAAIPGTKVGRWATVGAGAVVLGEVPEGAAVAGVPARALGTPRR
jgi:sugar O-acyltransferase (sialic acid O-acetyltransferase NeuD family)